MYRPSVVIQGVPGAFHEIAARQFFGETIQIIASDTFSGVVQHAQSDTDFGVMAIENTIAGSLLPNYALIKGSGLHIVGEIYLRIEQNLAVLPGQSVESLREVQSHPIALLQCEQFFKLHSHIKLVESVDTALSAKEISEQQLVGVGAVCSQLAADMYGLQVVAKGIETNKRNFTRFLVLSREPKLPSALVKKGTIKVSASFSLLHELGTLANVLSILALHKLNLTKIQSLPIVGQAWEYQFYIDFLASDVASLAKALQAVGSSTSNLHILGQYIEGDKTNEQTHETHLASETAAVRN